MIKYFKAFYKRANDFFLKKIPSHRCIFNIKVDTNKINYFLELKNVKDKKNFLWFGNWDDKKIDLSNYRKYSPSYNSVFQIYKENINYKQSEEYKIKLNLINDGKKSGRGKNLEELNNYFLSLDIIKNSLKKFGYKSQIELNNFEKANDEIGVVIGKNWELIKLQDKFGGTHRFALSKIFNINRVVISVKAMHHTLFEKNDIKKILSTDNEEVIKTFLKEKINRYL